MVTLSIILQQLSLLRQYSMRPNNLSDFRINCQGEKYRSRSDVQK